MKIRTLVRMIEKGQDKATIKRANAIMEKSSAESYAAYKKGRYKRDLLDEVMKVSIGRTIAGGRRYKRAVKQFGVNSTQAETVRKAVNTRMPHFYNNLRKGRFTPTLKDD